LLPAAHAAKKRGVVFDVGHGGGSFDFTVAEAALAEGVLPDTLSSDIHVFSGNSPGLPYLTNVMGKFMALGLTLEQVVSMTTAAPAKVIDRLPKHGTLQVGAPADVTVLEIVNGPVEWVDTRNNKRPGKVALKPTNVVVAGVAFGQPYQAPFSPR
jgi:dihydroorotase